LSNIIIIKKTTARTTEKTVHRIMRISKGINHNSVVIRIEVFSKGITVVRDVKEKENVFI
jgi:transaldolase